MLQIGQCSTPTSCYVNQGLLDQPATHIPSFWCVILLRIREDQRAAIRAGLHATTEAGTRDDATLLANGNARELAVTGANHRSDGAFFPGSRLDHKFFMLNDLGPYLIIHMLRPVPNRSKCNLLSDFKWSWIHPLGRGNNKFKSQLLNGFRRFHLHLILEQ